jgi:hypothetical protein
MKKSFVPLFYFIIAISSLSFISIQHLNFSKKEANVANDEMYNQILMQDSIFFNAYNTCNLEKQAGIYDNSIEFYHDKGGLMTSKIEILDGTKKYICGKVKRILVDESVEVHAINGFGAVEMGTHKFQNYSKKDLGISEPEKFVIIWKNVDGNWKISRVISLHE